MMYIHYCKKCNSLRMLSGHKTKCPACDNRLIEITIGFEVYSGLSANERALLLEQCKTKYS